MCSCGKPTRNDQAGYSWDGKSRGTYGVSAPELPENFPSRGEYEIIYDEMGRCSPIINGKPYHVDHHSHHYRVFKRKPFNSASEERHGGHYILMVRHGGGDEIIGNEYDISKIMPLLAAMDSDSRFVMFMGLGGLVDKAEDAGRQKTAEMYSRAFVEGRLKKSRANKYGQVTVRIEDPTMHRLKEEARAEKKRARAVA